MQPKTLLLILLVTCFLTTACQRAARFPAIPISAADKKQSEEPPLQVKTTYGWSETEKRPDIPILFVSLEADPDEWNKLPKFWNHFPGIFSGMRTIHLGQSPLGAAVAMAIVDQLEVVKIKVPLGLPDPAPYIPKANPPSVGKWLLGKRLFFDKSWLTSGRRLSCADCHLPGNGFSEDNPPQSKPRKIAPSLINCVYNRSQFWNGRAQHLEEVLQRRLQDEAETVESSKDALYRHVFSGVAKRLGRNPRYVQDFRRVFGVVSPTVDSAAKALATYQRTILSGNSLFDRLQEKLGEKDPGEWTVDDFLSFLQKDEEKELKKLARANVDARKVAEELRRGTRLFFSKHTHCRSCHVGWNFADGDYHNISIRESDHGVQFQKWEGPEYGRFLYAPLGLKETRLIGAFRTPSLRNLPQTAPYFHDGSRQTLENAVGYYNKGIHDQINANLDPVLRAAPYKAKRLNLTMEEEFALALFLRSLKGDPIPAIVRNR